MNIVLERRENIVVINVAYTCISSQGRQYPAQTAVSRWWPLVNGEHTLTNLAKGNF